MATTKGKFVCVPGARRVKRQEKDLSFPLPSREFLREQEETIAKAIEFVELQEEAARQKAERRDVSFKMVVVPTISFARMAASNAISNGVVIHSVPRAPLAWISRAEARKDKHLAYQKFLSEKEQARLLCEAIAWRYAQAAGGVKHRPRKTRTERNRLQRYQSRHPAREVEQFSKKAYPFIYPVDKLIPDLPKKSESVKKAVSNSPKQVKKRTPLSSFFPGHQFIGPRNKEPELPNRRVDRVRLLSSMLCRTVIGRALWEGIMRKCYSVQIPDLTEFPRGQMDAEGVEDLNPQQVSGKSNVNLVEEERNIEHAEVGAPISSFQPFAASRSVTDTLDRYTDRWIFLSTVKWRVSDAVGKDLGLGEIGLPRYLFKKDSGRHLDTPNLQMFLTHRYFRSDMRVKVVINSNQFQVGSLLVNFIYGDNDNLYWSSYDELNCVVQREHAMISAAPGSSAELFIPFKYVNSLMTINDAPSLGKLRLNVLNPLIVQDGVATECSVSIFVAFENAQFYGMIGRNLGVSALNVPQGQMDTLETIESLCNVGARAIRALRPEPNRDNPPAPIMPVPVMPVATSSFSYTDACPESVVVLRADPRGQTPAIATVDEMLVSSVAQTPGLLKTISWNVNQRVDTMLLKLPVAPLMSSDQYHLAVEKDTFKYYSYPPISCVSSLFGKWRGDIIYTFQVVCSQYHAGRLLVGLEPLPSDEGDRSLWDIRNSPHEIHNIKGTTTFSFNASWYWRNAWANTRSLQGKAEYTGRLYLKVVNPLICVDRVAPSVYINVYMKAGDNFELAIPRPSILAPLNTTPIVPPSTQYLRPYNKQSSWYTTYERNLIRSDDGYGMTIYMQNITDGWVGYLDPKLGEYYILSETTSAGHKYRCSYLLGGTINYVKYAVYDPALTTSNAKGLLICETEDSAISAARAFLNASTPEAQAEARKFGVLYKQDGDWSQIQVNNQWVQNTNDEPPPVWSRKILSSSEARYRMPRSETSQLTASVNSLRLSLDGLRRLLEAQQEAHIRTAKPAAPKLPQPRPPGPTGQMDTGLRDQETRQVYKTEIPVPVTNMGLTTFGEQVSSLKSLCRRWIHHCSVNAPVIPALNPSDMVYLVKMPVQPLRLINPRNSYEFDNRVREGIISYISSGYTFWRGGLRYRFMVTGDMPEGCTIYVQHRFDEPSNKDSKMMEEGKKVRTASDLLLTQYATAAQALSVNSTLTVEVPYYRENEQLWIRPNSLDENSNGYLYVWIHSQVKTSVAIEVYYSFADDCRFSLFQGFPPMMDIGSIIPEPQMDTEGVEPQGAAMSSTKEALKVPQSINNASKHVANLAATSQIAVADARTRMSTILDSLSASYNRIKQKSQGFSPFDFIKDHAGPAFSIASHIVYAIIEPRKGIVIWSIINIILLLFGDISALYTKITEAFGTVWEKFSKIWTSQPTGQMDDGSGTSDLAGVLFVLLTTVLKVKLDPPTDWRSCMTGLFVFGAACKSRQVVGAFITDVFKLLKNVYEYILSKLGVEHPNKSLIMGLDDKRLQTWMIEAGALTATTAEESVMTRPDWGLKVFELIVVGRAYQFMMVDPTLRTNFQAVRQHVDKLMTKLTAIEKRMINQKVYCAARYEPYTLWLAGDAGSGKSRFSADLAEHFAKMLKYEGPVVYYARTSGQAYFDGYRDQPTILVDDFLSLPFSADPVSYTQFLQMKSSNLFNPPYAEATEKDRLINFQNLVITSNKSYFENLAGIHDTDAYNRRRDLLLTFELASCVDKTRPLRDQFSDTQLDEFHHVNVWVHNNVINPQDPKKVLIERPTEGSYRERVLKVILDNCREYHRREGLSYLQRINAVKSRLNVQRQTTETLDDYLARVEKLFGIPNESGESTQNLPAEIKRSLAYWKNKCKEACEFNILGRAPDPPNRGAISRTQSNNTQPIVTGQMETDFDFIRGDLSERTWTPHEEDPDLPKHYNHCYDSMGLVVEPLNRKTNFDLHLFKSKKCHHRQLLWQDWTIGMRGELVAVANDFSKYNDQPLSVMLSPCVTVDKGEVKLLTDCVFQDGDETDGFLHWLINLKVLDNSHWLSHYSVRRDELPPILQEAVDKFGKITNATLEQSVLPMHVMMELRQAHKRHVKIGPYLFSRDPRDGWKEVAWREFLCFLEVIWTTIKVLCGIIIGILASSAILSLFGAGETVKGELHSSGDYKTLKNQTPSKPIKPLSYTVGESNTEGVPASNMDGITNKLARNIVFLKAVLPSGKVCSTRCLGLYDRKILILKHYIDHFIARGVHHVDIIFSTERGVINVALSDLKIVWYSDGYGVGEIPVSVPYMFCNIVKYMPSVQTRGFPTNCQLMEIHLHGIKYHNIHANQLNRDIYIPANRGQRDWTITQGFEYKWGGSGKCGTLLLAPTMATPLIGIHTAGIGGAIGYSELLVKETFMPIERDTIEYIAPSLDVVPQCDLEGEYLIDALLPPEIAVHQPIKTKIQQSDIHGVFEVTTEPAPLTYSDSRLIEQVDPLRVGTSRRCNKIEDFEEEDIREAKKDLMSKILLSVPPVRTPGVLNYKQAIEGLELPGYEAMKMSTSEGWPWTLARPKGYQDKRWLFKTSEYPSGRICVEGIQTQLADTLQKKHEMRVRGIVPNSPFVCTLKDARIPKEKVKIPGKTRVFEICPVDLTIAQRQYYLDFIVSYQTARFEAENTIGINCDGPEWTKLATQLENFSPYILTADYSGYGPRMSSRLLEEAFDIEIEWYKKYSPSETLRQDSLVRRVIMHEVAHGPHIYKNIIFRPTAGMPSGNPATVQKNSLVNSLYIRIAYLGIMKERRPEYADMYWFNKFVLIFHNGDDLIMSVKETIICDFNNNTLIEFFGHYGLKMTDALKSGVTRDYCSLEEATYLKRGFLRHPTRHGQWLAPLEEASITDTANWIWKSINTREASLVNSEMTIRLAYTRGPDYYDKICNRIKERWAEEGVKFDTPSWSSLDLHVWEGVDGPTFTMLY